MRRLRWLWSSSTLAFIAIGLAAGCADDESEKSATPVDGGTGDGSLGGGAGAGGAGAAGVAGSGGAGGAAAAGGAGGTAGGGAGGTAGSGAGAAGAAGVGVAGGAGAGEDGGGGQAGAPADAGCGGCTPSTVPWGLDPRQVTLVIDPAAGSCDAYPGYQPNDSVVFDDLGGGTYYASWGSAWTPTSVSAGTLNDNDGGFWSWESIPGGQDVTVEITEVASGFSVSVTVRLSSTGVEIVSVCPVAFPAA
jgi:hypothetical protein